MKTVELPTEHQLQAAVHVLGMVGTTPAIDSDLHASYQTVATGGILSSRDLVNAESWLVSRGWLRYDSPWIQQSPAALQLPSQPEPVAKELLRAFLLDAQPIWLSTAVGIGRVRQELIPDRDIEILAGLFPSPDEREALLIAAAQRVDADRLIMIGEAGEIAVMQACKDYLHAQGRPELAKHVRRVSLLSDHLGYDVASPDLNGVEHRLEVKCFSGRNPTFILTRNEHSVGSVLSNWAIVLCRMNSASSAQVVGWTTLGSMYAQMPEDKGESVRWHTARVSMSETILVPGIPLIAKPD